MKLASTLALGAALALGTTAVVGTQPAFAQKEKAGKAPKLNLSKGVREPASAAQTALAANDLATGQAKLQEASAAASTPDDKYVVGSLAYDLARKQNNEQGQFAAIEQMLSSGKVSADQAANYNTAAAQLAYKSNNFQKAETYLMAAMEGGSTDPNVPVLLVETKQKLGKTPEAVQTLQQIIAKQKAAGQPVPKEWYARGVAIAYAAKLPAETTKMTQEWLAAYPGDKTSWRDSIQIWRETNKPDAEADLDALRLLRAAGAMKGQADYMEYVDRTYLRFPGEAKAVLDEGMAAGVINTASSQNAREISGIVNGKVQADKASLPKTPPANGTAKSLLSVGDAHLGYKDYAKAAEFYRAALGKGADAGVVNTRLGMALAGAGDKAGAKQAFSQVSGPRQGLAQFWTIWVDQQA